MKDTYDVVVIGGGFSGSASALLLRRWMPGVRVLIVERRAEFDRKVGEATVELSGMFLHRVLKLYDHLSREHLPKHGLRFWFHGRPDDTLESMSEVGPAKVSALPSFQLDRARLDEHLLGEAVGAGAELMRPAQVKDVQLGWPESTLTVTSDGGDARHVRCRWVIDASGRHSHLAKRLDLLERTESHPTQAAWGRWKGVKDIDGPDVAGADASMPKLKPVGASRRLATNHFTGYGYWIWVIPLAGGETSVGVVFDKRHFKYPGEGRPIEQYTALLRRTPGLRDLLVGAELEEGDFRAYAHLPYRSKKFMDRGWSLVGDSGAFLDPYYSPGLDYCAISVYATARLIEDDLSGKLSEADLADRVTEHDGNFRRSYPRWLAALYLDKYELLGDAELTTATFLFDTGMYYLGVVGTAFRNVEEFRNPLFSVGGRRATVAYRTMSFFRGRLVRLARIRRHAGTYGKRNRLWKFYPGPFGIGWSAVRLVLRGSRLWLRLELEGLWWRCRHPGVDLSQPVPDAALDIAPLPVLAEPAPAPVSR